MAANPIKLAARLVHHHFGFAQVALASYRDLILAVTTEPKATNPINAEYEVTKPLFENKTNPSTKVARGVLEGWEIAVDGRNDKYLQRIWDQTGKGQAMCLHWDKDASQVAVGFKQGNVMIIKINPSNNTEFEVTMDRKVCKGAVVQVEQDPANNMVYAIGLDGFIHRCDYRSQMTTFSKRGLTQAARSLRACPPAWCSSSRRRRPTCRTPSATSWSST